MNKKKILIIGSRGFLGSSLANYLSKFNYDVITLSRSNGDLLDYSSWESIPTSEKYEAIYFCIEKSGNQLFFEKNSSFDLISHNQKLIMNMDIFMKNLKFPSKLFTFGSLWTADKKIKEIDESDLFNYDQNDKVSALKIIKIILYEFIKKLNKFSHHSASIITTGTLYGYKDQSDHLIPSILSKLSSQPDEIRMFGKGNSIRNYTYIGDFIYCLKKILESPISCPESLIVASDKNYRIDYLIETIAEKFGVIKLIWGDKEDDIKIRIPIINKFINLYELSGYAFRGIETFDEKDLIKWI